MKRLLALVLLVSMALSLAACASPSAVTYYYVRNEAEYLYGDANGVMAGESREVAGHLDDLRYLLSLYLHGPISDNLESPFPAGTELAELTREADALTVRLTSIFTVLEGTDLTLACACMARTCFALTDVQSVTILSMGRETVSMTMGRESFLLMDDSADYLPQESE